MYTEARKGPIRPMQSYLPSSSNGLSQQARRIATMAILLFALSGLISGFAVGAFVKPKLGSWTPNAGNGNTAVSQKNTTRTPVSTVRPINLGYPVVSSVKFLEKTDSTTYSLSAYAVDQSIDKGHGKPVHAAGITCKLWLEHIPDSGTVSPDQSKIKSMSLQQPLTPDELVGVLNFDENTPQVQPTDSNGHVTWRYTISNQVTSGNYYLVILMDWQGKHYNWSWVEIKIKSDSNS
jgi:hypothetical protein